MIESLHSPHIGRVKALLSSRGARERSEKREFVAEGLQSIREALASTTGPQIRTLYATESGLAKLVEDGINLTDVAVEEVSDGVMKAMADTVTPQGILAICTYPSWTIGEIKGKGSVIYLHRIQDPGNAGTIIRTAQALGISAVITSPESVDLFSPKVVRSAAGSHWHLPLFENISLDALISAFPDYARYALMSYGDVALSKVATAEHALWIFGNEAQGLKDLIEDLASHQVQTVAIPMAGETESLNLSVAAAIVMYAIGQ
jgi:TrmH family RNA methyltransferase